MRNERGAITIHVAIALCALLMFAGIVIDQGAFYVARRQAQNAADAGVLAGARELVPDPGAHADAALAAKQFANLNAVWGQAAGDANINVQSPITCPDGTNTCIAVWVMRGLPDQNHVAHGNSFPTFLMRLFGPSNQGARAYAMAQVKSANKTECMKPWAIPDQWQENGGTAGVFDPGIDTYIPPTTANAVPPPTYTGYDLTDVGTILTLKEGDPHDVLNPSFYYEVGDASSYDESIEGCSLTAQIGGMVRTLPGNRKGPTKTATQNLIDQDPYAQWDSTAKQVVNSDPKYPASPRIVAIAMFSPQEYYDGDKQSGEFDLHLVNMMAFFVQSVDNQGTVTGVICANAALFTSGAGEVANDAGFLRVSRLVQ